MARQTAESIVDEIAQKVANKALDDFMRVMEMAERRLESPIERVMFAALFYIFGDGEDFAFLIKDFSFGENPSSPYDQTDIYIQALVGTYRVDFLFDVHTDENRKFMVIECDGHDFHERTKEQAARDRARDRWMARQGITVVRFTGSKIWKDAISCAREVETLYCKIQGYDLGHDDA